MTEHTAGLAPRITLGMLRGACKEQRAIFRAEWPEGAEVTIENVRRAQELRLSLAWGEQWFTALALEAYDEATAPALKAYNEATAPAWKVYHEARANAWKVYHEARANAWKVYHEARANAWKVYEEATAPALKAYNEATAQEWVAAYIQSVAEREMQK